MLESMYNSCADPAMYLDAFELRYIFTDSGKVSWIFNVTNCDIPEKRSWRLFIEVMEHTCDLCEKYSIGKFLVESTWLDLCSKHLQLSEKEFSVLEKQYF